MKKQLKRPVALITGGAKRLGQAIAIALAKRGYDIAIHFNQSYAAAEKTAKTIKKMKVECALFQTDLTNADEVATLVSSVKASFGRVDLLVNSASVFKRSKLVPSSLATFEEHFNVNLKAPYILMTDFAKQIKKGQIINLLDTDIDQIKGTHAAYLLSKKALADLTLLAAKEFAPTIRVNGVCPGLVLPPVNQSNANMKARANRLPLKKRGQPEDITRAVEYLLDNNFVTGQFLYADGGERLL